MHKKILFITPYPNDSAGSQRFRFEQFLDELSSHDISYKQVPFLDQSTWKIFYKPGFLFKKIWGLLKGVFRRIYCLFIVPSYDIIFIHREAAPIGPPIVEIYHFKNSKSKDYFRF